MLRVHGFNIGNIREEEPVKKTFKPTGIGSVLSMLKVHEFNIREEDPMNWTFKPTRVGKCVCMLRFMSSIQGEKNL